MWVTAVPPSEPGELSILLAVNTLGEPDERLVCDLLNYGHEGEEDVFYLLPGDLWARVEVTGTRLGVRLVTSPDRIAASLAERDESCQQLVAELTFAELPDGRVTVLHREIGIDPTLLRGHYYPDLQALPDDLRELVEAWEAEEKGEYVSIFMAPDRKVGGYAQWAGTDLLPTLCPRCAGSTVLVLVIDSSEYDAR